MNSPNSANHSKIAAFEKLKPLLCKYYLRFVKNFKNSEHLNKLLVLVLYDSLRSLSINALLDESIVLEIGTGKYATTALNSKTTKPEFFFHGTKAIKRSKITKKAHAFKSYAYTYNVEILNSFNPELEFKYIKSTIKK